MPPQPWFGITLVLTVFMADLAAGADWPHWRGASRSGVVDEKSGYADGRWLPDRPDWTAQVGKGASSPVVVGDSVYVLGHGNGADKITCLEVATGRERWSKSYDCPARGRQATGDEGFYEGPSSTPSFDRRTNQLYTLSVDGDLQAWDGTSGQNRWRRNLYDAYQIARRPKVGRQGRRDYGYTTSPLVTASSVVVEVGADSGTLMGFDARSGERIWSSQHREPAGHTGSPVPMTVGGRPCVAVLTLRDLLIARLDAGHEGETRATYPWITDFANNIPTPAVQGDEVLLTTKYNHESICKVRIDDSGATKVWEQPYASGVCSPVIHAGRVYWSTHRAFALDFSTGKRIWDGGQFGDAGSCLITRDDKLVIWANKGTLALLDASPTATAYRELARRELGAPSDVWPHVVLANGRLYCKDREGLLRCFALSGYFGAATQ